MIDKNEISGAFIDSTCGHVLDQPQSFFMVKKGHMDIFITPVEKTEDNRVYPSGGSEYCFRIEADNIILGMPLQEVESKGLQLKMTLWGVPHVDSEIIKGDIKNLISSNFNLTSIKYIDSWIQLLDKTMSSRLTLPRQYDLLEAELQMQYGKGTSLSAHHMDTVWLEAPASIFNYGGKSNLEVPKGNIHPITHWATVKLKEDSIVNVYHTPAIMLRDDFKKILYAYQCFFMRVMVFNFFSQAEHNRRTQEKYQKVLLSREEETRRLLIGGPSDKKKVNNEDLKILPDKQESLVQIGKKIAKEWGMELSDPSRLRRSSPIQTLENMGFSVRKVDLHEWDYQKHIGGYLIGRDKNNQKIVGFLPPHNNRKYYTYFEPEKKEERMLSQKDIANISFSALLVYPPFPEDIRDVKKFMNYIFSGKKRDIRVMLSTVVINAIFFIMIPLLAGKILTEYIPGNDWNSYVLALGGFCVAGVASVIIYFVSSLFYTSMSGHFSLYTQTHLWNKIITLPLTFFQRHPVGEILSRMNGIHAISGMLNVCLIQYFSNFISGIVGVALLFYFNVTFTLILLSIVMFLILIDYFLFRKILSLEKKSHELEFKIKDFVLQTIHALSKIRMARREQFFLFRWAKNFHAKRVLIYRIQLLQSFYQLIHSHFLFYSNIALCLMASSNPQSFNLEYYIVFNMVLVQLSFSLNEISALINLAIGAIPFFNRLRLIIHTESPRTSHKIHPKTLRGRIQFSHVSFSYRSSQGTLKPVLKDISFTVEPGEYVAIVGTSGSGKSTIVRLMLGLESLQSGSIQLDQYDIEDLNLQSLREQIGTVLQSTKALPTSVIKNIAMGAEQEEIRISQVFQEAWASLDKASLKKEIEEMPMGMHTSLIGTGDDMSGGQQQRLMLARALNKKPRILILDEASSAMDNITQSRVKKVLDGLNTTRIVIAHRLSTITNVHRIIMLKEGRIVEQGSYQGLMQAGGEFAKFAQRQIF